MAEQERGPSYLAVDRMIAAGDAAGLDALADPELRAHRQRVAEVDVGTIPPWVVALGPRRRARWRLAWPVLALMAAVLLVVAVVPREPDPWVAQKGAPAAVVHVVRAGGEREALWDGTPLRRGDRIRLELGGIGDDQAWAVVHVAPGAPAEVLARGVGDGLVDGTWAVEPPVDGERLVVVEDGPDAAALLGPDVLVSIPLR